MESNMVVYVSGEKNKSLFSSLHPKRRLLSSKKGVNDNSVVIRMEQSDLADCVQIRMGSFFPGFFEDFLRQLIHPAVNGVITDRKSDLEAYGIHILFHESHAQHVVEMVRKLDFVFGALKDVSRYSSFFSVLHAKGATSSIIPHNMIEVNSRWAQEHGFFENESVLVMHMEQQLFLECCLQVSSNVNYAEVKAANLVKNSLGLSDNSRIMLFRHDNIICDRVVTQNVSDVKDKNITLSKDLYERINPGFKECQLIHLATGALYTIPTNKIKQSQKYKTNSVQLNYYQRQILHLCTPVVLLSKYYESIRQSEALSQEEKQYLDERYCGEKAFVTDQYMESQKVYQILCKAGYERLQIVPCIESHTGHHASKCRIKLSFRSLVKGLADFFVGSSSMTLKCVRPYMIDEDKDIVRISQDNMVMLGLEETDRVVIRFRSKCIKAKVFRIDSVEQIRESNIIGKDAMIDTIIGIPVHLRRKLDIHNINVGVHVERDTGYLFGKNSNKQFLPILALLFTLLQTFSSNIPLVLFIFFVTLPIVVYIVFSEVRSQIK